MGFYDFKSLNFLSDDTVLFKKQGKKGSLLNLNRLFIFNGHHFQWSGGYFEIESAEWDWYYSENKGLLNDVLPDIHKT